MRFSSFGHRMHFPTVHDVFSLFVISASHTVASWWNASLSSGLLWTGCGLGSLCEGICLWMDVNDFILQGLNERFHSLELGFHEGEF